MVQRQLPKVGELLELMQFEKPELDARTRRLDAALTIADLRAIAKRRTPKAAFDYTDGAAEGELSLARAEIERTMTLLGVSSLAELEPRHVTQLTRLVPVGDSAVDAGR